MKSNFDQKRVNVETILSVKDVCSNQPSSILKAIDLLCADLRERDKTILTIDPVEGMHHADSFVIGREVTSRRFMSSVDAF
jgi:hypothetical protein